MGSKGGIQKGRIEGNGEKGGRGGEGKGDPLKKS